MTSNNSPNTLVYTFSQYRNLTNKVLRNISNNTIDKYFIGGGDDYANCADTIVATGYNAVIGLGDYRKNAKRIRIEGKFLNKYGKSEIDPAAPNSYQASLDLSLNDEMYISDKPTWGPCNRSAFVIANAIVQNNLDTKLAFVHVPRSLDVEYVSEILSEWINAL
jgi:hypothetical protein